MIINKNVCYIQHFTYCILSLQTSHKRIIGQLSLFQGSCHHLQAQGRVNLKEKQFQMQGAAITGSHFGLGAAQGFPHQEDCFHLK